MTALSAIARNSIFKHKGMKRRRGGKIGTVSRAPSFSSGAAGPATSLVTGEVFDVDPAAPAPVTSRRRRSKAVAAKVVPVSTLACAICGAQGDDLVTTSFVAKAGDVYRFCCAPCIGRIDPPF